MPEQLTPSAEKADARIILERSIETEIQKGKQNVGEFTEGVKERVEEELEHQNGQRITAISTETRSLLDDYMSRTTSTLGKKHNVGDTASKGAVAWNDKGKGNEVVFDHSAVELNVDTTYWNKVRVHEEVHQLDQAPEYNMGTITFNENRLSVNPALVEWGAITGAAQSMQELTPDYQRHKADGDELVAFLGSPEPLLNALKTGDMAKLQEMIDRKMIAEKMRELVTQ